MTRVTREPRPERIFVQEGDRFELEEFERTLRDKYGPATAIVGWKELKGRTLEAQAGKETLVLFVRHPQTHEILGVVAGQVLQEESEVIWGSHLLIDPAYVHWNIGRELIARAKEKAESLGLPIEIVAEPLLPLWPAGHEPKNAWEILIRYYQRLGFVFEEYTEKDGKWFPVFVWRPSISSQR